MDILTLYADTEIQLEKHAIVRVFWCTGMNKRYALDVRLALSCNDKKAVA